MREKNECKNTQLSFYSEGSLTEFTSPVGDYFKNFPFMNYDWDLLNTRQEELSNLIKEFDTYFKSYKPLFQFPTGIVSYPHEIWIDKSRIDQLKNGFIPVYILFVNPYIPNSKGNFNWDE